MEDFAAAIEASWLAVGLRQSRWTYPAVNTLHIFGIALLVGAVVPMGLRLAGLWRDIALALVLRVLRPVAAVGAGLAVVTGFLLFSVQATDYAALRLFLVKMALVGVGLIHALLVGAGLSRAPPWRRRLAGAVSICVWTGALVCGRMLGYI